MKWGWYSVTADRLRIAHAVYATPDGAGELRCTLVTDSSESSGSRWQDIICLGPLGVFLRDEPGVTYSNEPERTIETLRDLWSAAARSKSFEAVEIARRLSESIIYAAPEHRNEKATNAREWLANLRKAEEGAL